MVEVPACLVPRRFCLVVDVGAAAVAFGVAGCVASSLALAYAVYLLAVVPALLSGLGEGTVKEVGPRSSSCFQLDYTTTMLGSGSCILRHLPKMETLFFNILPPTYPTNKGSMQKKYVLGRKIHLTYTLSTFGTKL